jgi:hypothetical protein
VAKELPASFTVRRRGGPAARRERHGGCVGENDRCDAARGVRGRGCSRANRVRGQAPQSGPAPRRAWHGNSDLRTGPRTASAARRRS